MIDEARTLARATKHDMLVALRRPVLSRRFTRAVRDASGPVKVNVGAGDVTLDGWLNTDIKPDSRLWLDLMQPWPVPSGRVAYIYADNVINLFSLSSVRQVFTHMFSALTAGGYIRLATPDLEATARAYLSDPDLTARHLERHRRKGYPVEYPADMLRVTYAYHRQHEGFTFDWSSLEAELTRAGFIDVRRAVTSQSSHEVFRDLEFRHEPTEIATQLVVEARRPDH